MTTPPISEVFKAGTLFDYAAWTNDSVITMANVNWDSSYDDVNRPDLAEAKVNAYIDGQASTNVTLDNMTHARFERPIRIALPFNKANQYNYIRVSNPIQHQQNPDIQKDYFYFIMSVGYVTPDVTEITVQLDAWTTFGKHFRVMQAFIESGHLGIANKDAFNNFGRDFLTIPEGRDIGGEYLVKDSARLKVMTNSWGTEGLGGAGVADSPPGFDVLVATTIDINAVAGTVDNPILTTAKGGPIQGLYSGASFYVFNGISGFANYMSNNRTKPWVTQGIISITLIPRVNRYLPGFDYNADATGPTEHANMSPAPPFAYPTLQHQVKANWREALRALLPEEYRHLDKMLVYPYTIVEMTTWGATPVILKPEAWADANATITESACIVPPSQRVVFSPQRYNAKSDSAIEDKKNWIPTEMNGVSPHELGPGDDGGEYLDVTTMIANFPTMPAVNDSAIAYLANNKHNLAYQNSSADWAYTKAGATNRASVDNSNTGINAARNSGDVSRKMASQLTSNTIETANSSMIAGAISNVATSTAGGAVAGPGGMLLGAGMSTGGAIASMVNTGIQNDSLARANSIQHMGGFANQEIGVGASSAISQTNAKLAAFGAMGDKANTIAGINAAVQDSRMTQPTTVGQMGGESFNLVFNNVEIALRFKMMDPAATRANGDYWLQYGYAVQAWSEVPISLMVMSKFSYWKMQAVYLDTANIPEFIKNTIKGILMKGVKVWENPADIGRISIADNVALPDITIGY